MNSGALASVSLGPVSAASLPAFDQGRQRPKGRAACGEQKATVSSPALASDDLAVPTAALRTSVQLAHEGWRPARRRGLIWPALCLHALVLAAWWQAGPAVRSAPRPTPVEVRLSEGAKPRLPEAAKRVAVAAPQFAPVSVPQLEIPVVPVSQPMVVAPLAAEPTSPVVSAKMATAAGSMLAGARGADPVVEGPRVVSSSGVQFLQPPVVVVPALSRRLGESGTVVLKVLVDARGVPRQITVHQSSGHARLDEQAQQAMRRARFKPYMENGEPMEMLVLTPIEYELLR